MKLAFCILTLAWILPSRPHGLVVFGHATSPQVGEVKDGAMKEGPMKEGPMKEGAMKEGLLAKEGEMTDSLF